MHWLPFLHYVTESFAQIDQCQYAGRKGLEAIYYWVQSVISADKIHNILDRCALRARESCLRVCFSSAPILQANA